MSGETGSHRLEGLATWSALTAALQAIQSPALVVDSQGGVVHANSAGARLLARSPRAFPPAAGHVVHQGTPDWRLTPLGDPADGYGFIAVLERSPPPPQDQRDRSWTGDLTRRQNEVLDLVARGLTNATIAEMLGIKQRTVEFHLAALFDKAGVDNRTTLLAKLLGP
jgi:DNA-binding NarL/FixJ family response regulator